VSHVTHQLQHDQKDVKLLNWLLYTLVFKDLIYFAIVWLK